MSRLAACLVAAVILAVTGADPSLADPPHGVTPKATDVVGVGSAATQYALDQLALSYDGQHRNGMLVYSWDAVNPVTGLAGGRIATKAGCRPMTRPDGSAAGIAALLQNTKDPSDPNAACIDYARSSLPPPKAGPGGVVYVRLADDAVTYATRDAASGGTSAPRNLSAAQLAGIYACRIRNWHQVGGKNAPIRAFIPRQGSDTRAVFLAAIGLAAPGGCVSDDPTRAFPHGALAENEGVNPVLNSPDAIVPYSVAVYIAQVYHSAACHPANCTGRPPCKPAGKQNLFGCDQHGVLWLNKINAIAPFTPWPGPRICPQCQINPGFSARFQYILSDVVRYSAASADHIPPYLASLFGPKGYACSTGAATFLRDYGFRPLPAAGRSASRSAVVLPSCGTPYP